MQRLKLATYLVEAFEAQRDVWVTPQSPFNGLDRVNRTLSDVVTNTTLLANASLWRTLVFPNDNDGATTQEVSKVETSVDGLKSMRTSFGLISTTVKTVPSSGSWTVTETAPDGSKVVNTNQNGRLVTVTRQNASGGQLSQTTSTYDVHGRMASMTDARNGTTTYAYDNADRVTSVTTPAPGNGQSIGVRNWGQLLTINN